MLRFRWVILQNVSLRAVWYNAEHRSTLRTTQHCITQRGGRLQTVEYRKEFDSFVSPRIQLYTAWCFVGIQFVFACLSLPLKGMYIQQKQCRCKPYQVWSIPKLMKKDKKRLRFIHCAKVKRQSLSRITLRECNAMPNRCIWLIKSKNGFE